jgi:Tfp pilus assembly protein PilF
MRRITAALAALLIFAGCASFGGESKSAKLSRSHYMMGNSYFAQNRIQDAFLEFQKSVAENPRNKDARNILGQVYAILGEYDKAVSSYREALDIDPDFADAHHNLAMTFVMTGRLDEAIAECEKVLEDPLYEVPETALNTMGYAQMMKGENEQAIDLFKKALLRRPIPQASYNLALAYERTGRNDDAERELARLVERHPGYAEAHFALARLCLKRGDTPKARQHFHETMNLAPDSEMGASARKELERLR